MLPGINEISRDDVSGTWIGSIAGVVKPSDERGLVSRQHWCRTDTRPIILLIQCWCLPEGLTAHLK